MLLTATLDAVDALGLLADIGTLHLDAVALVITVKLVKWANRWSPAA